MRDCINNYDQEIPQEKEIVTNLVQTDGYSPHTLFFSSRNPMRKLHEEFLIENRHQSRELQEAYDHRFGLVLRQ